MTWEQALIMAVLQGFAELFPISSLGHSVILPSLVGWGDLQKTTIFLPFLVLLHLGTACALFVFYRRQWLDVIRAFAASAVRGRLSHTPEEHLAWMLFFGTLPAGIIGAVFQEPLRHLFATPLVAAVFLAINGVIMLLGERLRGRQQRTGTSGVSFRADEPEGLRTIADLNWREALVVGSVQALALVPGISRSGVTICGGLLINLRHDEAARFAFMLATPIIAAAGLVAVPDLFSAGGDTLVKALVGGVLAAITAYLSVRFLERYFRFGRLDPFAYYCIVAGVASAVFFIVHGA